MKRLIILLALMVFVVGLVFIASQDMAFCAWGKDKDAAKAEEATKATEKASEQKTVYNFKNTDEMEEFENLYVAKQATFGRMGVLQAYFAMEQNNLAEIDKQMEEKFGFKMDPNKIYDLNRDTMEIKEAGPAPQAPALAE